MYRSAEDMGIDPKKILKDFFGYEKNYTEDSGSRYYVMIFNDIVLKVPRKDKPMSEERLNRITEVHNYFTFLPEVMPMVPFRDYFVMPRCPGVHGNKLSGDNLKRAYFLVDRVIRTIKDQGYFPDDIKVGNSTYDEKTDRLYVFDFHKVVKEE